jgi:hypothetical protein
MTQERLWPTDNEGVIREIIPGGHEERRYLLYPSQASVRIARRLEKSRFVPKLLASLMDDSMPVDRSRVDEYPTDEHELAADTDYPEMMLHDTVSGWRDEKGASRAA